jgi:signal transduction histidine kinase
MPKRGAWNTRAVLLAGFGGVLALMLFAGLESRRNIGRIRAREQDLRLSYQTRTRILNQIRSDLYLSGTYVRDYLLEPDNPNAEAHRGELEQTRRSMDAALSEYQRILTGKEAQPLAGLERELARYWQVLDPVLRWTAAQRRAGGYRFLRDELFPRRMAMLEVAGQIAVINDNLLADGARDVQSLFADFSRRLALTVLLTLGLGAALAVFSIRLILELEREAAARYGEIVLARRELRELSAKLEAAQEEERRSISRELHDEVGQSLSAALVELGILSSALPASVPAETRSHADTIRRLVESSVAAVRNLALLLRPSMLDDLGLVPALEWQAREIFRRTGMRVSVAADDVPEDLPETHRTCVYRVVQEALHNCSRHADARKVTVTVRREPRRLLLSVADDGKGFDVLREKGLGLLGMEERVARLNGAFHIQSRPGEGSVLSVTLPLEDAGANR